MADKKEPLISVKNASYRYGGSLFAVKNVSLDLYAGERVAILGRNGSGKSTLARLLNGLLTPTQGTVEVAGKLTTEKSAKRFVHETVGMVFQNPDNQMVASVVEDDVAFGLENLGIAREEMQKRVAFALSAVGMTEYKDRPVAKLSGGQKQRVAIAGVLALSPRVLILDEATSMLDPKGREEILAIVKELNEKKGVTVVNVTHYMEEAVDAHRVFVMGDGTVEKTGTPAEIFKDGELAEKLGLTQPLPAAFSRALFKEGILGKDGVLTKEDLVENLWQSLAKN